MVAVSAVAAAQTSEPDVSVVTVRPQPRAIVRELPGRVAPTRVSDVRPRVSGIVIERMFSQGSEVKAGDPLMDGPRNRPRDVLGTRSTA